MERSALRIGFLTELFPPSRGGQEQRFSELAELLAMQGHQVTVICIKHSAQVAAEERLASGVVVIRQPSFRYYYKPFGGLLPRSPLGVIQYALAARRLTLVHEFDVLFLNQWPLLHILALPRRYRTCAVIDWCEIRSSLAFRVLQRVLPRLVAANTAVSTQVAEHLHAVANSRVMVLPSGINAAHYRMNPGRDRCGLLYIGRLTRHKNIPLLIDAFEELCRGGFAEPLIIAGNGPAFNSVRQRVRNSPYAERIELLGWVDDDRKFELLAGTRLLMLTSRREGFPRIVAEAMASGLPVVTARFPQNGTVAVVEEYQCGLCAASTPRDLASAVCTVLGDWETWSARAHLPAQRLDWSSLGWQLETLLSETVAMSRHVAAPPESGEMRCGSW